MKVLTAIYNHPEFYPPTLNAINELATVVDEVIVLSRNVKKTEWIYPANIRLVLTGKPTTIKRSQHANAFWKIISFFLFTRKLRSLIKKNKPRWVICYDPIPLMAFLLIRPFLSSRPMLWYHNHDVMIAKAQGKFSISWFATQFEKKAFNKIDVFSLPSNERCKYFDMSHFKGKYFYIPNYPLKAFYDQFDTVTPISDELKLIYQGTISEGHGIKEIIAFISQSHGDIHFTLIGNIERNYKAELLGLIADMGLQQKVEIKDPVSYLLLPAITAQHHIGIAVNVPESIIYATGGTASNKIYEYAALGLPILYFDNEHYNQFLSKYSWAFATDLTVTSIQEQVEAIRANFQKLSKAAVEDFHHELNFEAIFFKVKHYIKDFI